jgi:Recombination endonuclease VII
VPIGHGMTRASAIEMIQVWVDRKPAACECCGKTPPARQLCLDHDHDSGLIRGWLCPICNTIEGHIRTGSVERVRAFIEARTVHLREVGS